MKRSLILSVRIIMLLVVAVVLRTPSAYAATTQQTPTISISVKDMPLRDFLSNIEQKCDYTFFYSSSVLDGTGVVSIDAKNKTIDQILDEALRGTGRTFEIVGNKIAIKLSSEAPKTSATQTQTVSAKSDAPHTVSGTILDENGRPMPGVGVIVVGTLSGTVTDVNGKYSIKAAPSQTLQFSFLGYEDKSAKVGTQTDISFSMRNSAQALESVVVTALGMKRDEKSLGYAATKVDGDKFATSSNQSNWLNGLSGQVAGLNMDRTNSGPGGSMRVTIRGESSVDLANNSALFVIDGVPMFNTSTASTAGGDDSTFAVDYGDGTSDVNPDDIESITVLKGPAATALYGSSAANGAIIITTKSGDKIDGSLRVTYSGSVMFESLATSPDLQYEYGQGSDADLYYYIRSSDSSKGTGYNPELHASTVSLESWGPRMDGRKFYQYYDDSRSIGGYYDKKGDFQRVATPYVSYGDWFKDYFQTGYSVSNTVSLYGKINKNNSLRITLNDNRNSGMTPNSASNRQFVSVKSRSKITKWFSAETSFNYRRQHCDNIPTSSGYGSTAIMYGLWTYAPNVNMDWVKNYWLAGQEDEAQDSTLSGGKNNAYFLANECVNTQDRHRLYGNVKFDFNLYKGLTLMVRGGVDTNTDFRTQRQATSTQANKEGWYREQNIANVQYTGEFLLKYEHRFGSDFNLTGNFGGSIMNRSYRRHTQTADKLNLPGIYSLANSLGEVKVDNYGYTRQTNSLYGLIQFSWKNAIFLDLTGRNDWSSTLPAGNRSYFYPSVSGSVVLNELIDFGRTGGLVNLLKIRASWAQVGHDTAPYRIENYLASTKFPSNVSNPSSKGNTNLKPEIVTSWEIGVDLRMFRNRLNIDAAYYDGTSKNLIANMPVSYSTGASSIYTNAGSIRNWGVEVSASGTLIKTKDFEWKLGVNWSLNRNEVLELGEGIDSWIVARYSSHALMTAYKGSSLTSMYGKGFQRAPKGSYAVDANGKVFDVSGHIVMDEFGRPLTGEDLQYIGDCSPKWQGGFNTTLTYKGIKLYIGFDGKFGGNVFSYTNWVLNYRGKSVNSLVGREGGFVAKGVQLMADGNYKINTQAIPREEISEYYHAAYSQTNAEANFVSTSFLKLREVRIEYALPKKVLAKQKVVSGVSFSVFGSNLYCWSKFPGWDPEGISMRGSAVVPGFEILQMPSGAQYGASVKLTF